MPYDTFVQNVDRSVMISTKYCSTATNMCTGTEGFLDSITAITTILTGIGWIYFDYFPLE
jgi:hypothetical protein